MKRTLTLFACVAICCAMMASCKNNKQSESTPEEIQAQKVALADSVLAEIDAVYKGFQKASEDSFIIGDFLLTEEEKMVKPDYLLDPSFAGTLVTKSQKANALGIYLVDWMVRTIYDMPTEDVKETVAKLALELNHPIDADFMTDYDMPASEKIKKEYEACKERGDLAYFWQLQNAVIAETVYVIAQNPALFFSKITEEQSQQFGKRTNEKNKAMMELAKYDEEMASVWEMFNKTCFPEEEREQMDTSNESRIKFFVANKERFIAHRNALLQ